MKKLDRVFTFLVVLCSLLLLANCKHDPPVNHGTGADADSLYVGRPYTIVNKTGTGTLRKVVIPSDNPETYEGIQLGRMLFYDSTLSLNRQVSCGSCHKQQYSFGDNTILSVNVAGPTKRNAPPLINMANTDNLTFTPFFWDGRQPTLEKAVEDAFTHEQQPDLNTITKYLDTTYAYSYLFKKAFGRPAAGTPLVTQDKIVKAISQFIRTLISQESRYDKLVRGEADLLNDEERRGLNIFLSQDSGDCAHCHSDAPYSTLAFKQTPMRNNALDTVANVLSFTDIGYGKVTGNASDYGKFKISTLRNIELTAPYMHDGRYSTLDQVANHYGTRDSLRNSPTVDPQMERFIKPIPDLDASQKQALIAFLKTLTDTAFINNPNFSNPFHH